MTSRRFSETAVSANLTISGKETSFPHLITIRDGRASQFVFLTYTNRKFAESAWRAACLDYHLSGNVFYHGILKSLIKIAGPLLLSYL